MTIEVIVLIKDAERYVFLYDRKYLGLLLETIDRFAASEELSFDYDDRAKILHKIKSTLD